MSVGHSIRMGFALLAGVTAWTAFASAQGVPSGTADRPAAQGQSVGATTREQQKFDADVKTLHGLFSSRKFSEAVVLAESVSRDADRIHGPGSKLAAGSAFNLGVLYRMTGRAKDAIGPLNRSMAYEAKYGPATAPSFTKVLDELVLAYNAAALAGEAADVIALALNKLEREAPDNLEARAKLLSKYGQQQRRAARFDAAKATLEKVLSIEQQRLGTDAPGLVDPLNRLAGLEKALGNYERSEELYLRAIALKRIALGAEPDTRNDANLGIILDNLAVLYLKTGRYHDAEPVQKEALAIIEATLGPAHVSTGQVFGNFAMLQKQMGRYGEAEALFARALEIYGKSLPLSDARIGVTLDNLGGVYREQGQYRKARDIYRRAMDKLLISHKRSHPEVGVAMNNLALSLTALGEFEEAESLLREAMAIKQAALGKRHPDYAISLGNLGDVQLSAGRLDEARASYKEAIEIFGQTVGAQSERALFPIRQLGHVELAAGNTGEGLRLFRQAAEIEVRLAAIGGRQADGGSVRHRGVFTGLIEAAWRARRDGVEDEDTASDIAFKAAQLSSLTAAGVAISKLGARLGTDDPALVELVRVRQDLGEAWSTSDAELMAAISKPSQKRDAAGESALRAKLAGISSQFDSLDAEIARRFPAFADLSRPNPVSIAGTQRLLKPDEAMLVYAVGSGHIDAWAVTATSSEWQRIAISRKELKAAITALRCGVDQGAWADQAGRERCIEAVGAMPQQGLLPFDPQRSVDLYAKLLEPFQAAIEGRHVLLALSGELSALPFQVLMRELPSDYDLRQAQWFGVTNPMTVLPSIASLSTLREQAKPSRARSAYFGLGNPLLSGRDGNDRRAWAGQVCPLPVAPARPMQVAALAERVPSAFEAGLFRSAAGNLKALRGLSPLPETVDEICAIAQTVGAGPANLLLGAKANEGEVRRWSREGRLADYRVLHFATHGLIAGDFSGLAEPALVLTPPQSPMPEDDGLLTASEVANLRIDADWVVLSACNTAAGRDLNAEALSGLARSFFYAGARSMLVSHWPVASDAAVKLTTAALDELQRDAGIGKAEALRRSMAALIASKDDEISAHPQIWAPFFIVGDGGASGVVKRRAPPAETASIRPASASADAGKTGTMPITTPDAPGPANGNIEILNGGIKVRDGATVAALPPSADAPAEPVGQAVEGESSAGSGSVVEVPPLPELMTAAREALPAELRKPKPVVTRRKTRPVPKPQKTFAEKFWEQQL